MPRLTQIYGVALILLGVGGYGLTGGVSVTALIPAMLGLPVLACGWFAQRSAAKRAHWMHGAVLLMFVGFAGTLRALPGLFAWLGGATPDRPAALLAQALMLAICLSYSVLAVRSFVRARRAASDLTTAA